MASEPHRAEGLILEREQGGERACPTCGGSGWEWSQETSGIRYMCPDCGGTGKEGRDGEDTGG